VCSLQVEFVLIVRAVDCCVELNIVTLCILYVHGVDVVRVIVYTPVTVSQTKILQYYGLWQILL
jgi:hypothetical protein